MEEKGGKRGMGGDREKRLNNEERNQKTMND